MLELRWEDELEKLLDCVKAWMMVVVRGDCLVLQRAG